MGRLEGRVAIVTGAGRGIGRGVALKLARDGAHVVVASRSKDTIDKVVGEILHLEKSAIGITVDVGMSEQIDAMVDKTVKTFGTVDVLVNVAQSWGPPGGKSPSPPETPLEEISEEEWNYTYQTGFKGTLYGMKAVFPYMKNQHRGRIINFGSPMALTGKAHMAAYNATKEAIRSLTLTASHEWGAYGITVNCVLPAILTEALADNHKDPKQMQALFKPAPNGPSWRSRA